MGIKLGDNCIQNFHLGRYILSDIWSEIYFYVNVQAIKHDFPKCIPPQMKILNIVIPILMHFCRLASNWRVGSRTISVSHSRKKGQGAGQKRGTFDV